MSIRTGRWRRWALEIARRALSLPKHHIKRAKCCSQGKGCLRAIYQALYRVHFPSQALSAVARSCIPSPSSLFPPRVLIHLLANESNLVVHPELPFSSLSPSPSLVATCLPLSVTRCRRETTHYLSLKLKFIQLNMSAVPIETSELKAGHPPAGKP